MSNNLNNEHPKEGDYLRLTGVVHNKTVIGLDLPNGKKGGNFDGRLENRDYRVYVNKFNKIGDNYYHITLIKPCGDRTKVVYKPKFGNKTLSQKNSQGSQQSWTWEKVEN